MNLREFIAENESVFRTFMRNGIVSSTLTRNCDIYDRKKRGESLFSISLDYNITVRSAELAFKQMKSDIILSKNDQSFFHSP